MTERDRLAALLREEVGPETTTPKLIDWEGCADRLIAAGMRLEDEGSLPEGIRREVRRLRADAAAIAAAYREDAG